MPGEPVNIICMKWGTRYPSRDVNILFRSIGRHLSRPFRFVCLTDDSAGLVEGIETLPFPENPGVTQVRWPNVFLPGKRGHSDHPKVVLHLATKSLGTLGIAPLHPAR